MIEGFCVGGGCQLALACDLRLAAADARFAITPARLGLVYPRSSTRRLVEHVGPSAAKLLLYSADQIDAGHALRIGLVDEVLPPGALADRVYGLARTMASRSQLTLTASKEIVDGHADEARFRQWQKESAAELAEGVSAFLERPPPRFPGPGDPVPPVPGARSPATGGRVTGRRGPRRNAGSPGSGTAPGPWRAARGQHPGLGAAGRHDDRQRRHDAVVPAPHRRGHGDHRARLRTLDDRQPRPAHLCESPPQGRGETGTPSGSCTSGRARTSSWSRASAWASSTRPTPVECRGSRPPTR
nr:hypothetical protein GCM10020093_034930 [Planobispora longispora]